MEWINDILCGCDNALLRDIVLVVLMSRGCREGRRTGLIVSLLGIGKESSGLFEGL